MRSSACMGKGPDAVFSTTNHDSVQLLVLDVLHSMVCCRIQTQACQEVQSRRDRRANAPFCRASGLFNLRGCGDGLTSGQPGRIRKWVGDVMGLKLQIRGRPAGLPFDHAMDTWWSGPDGATEGFHR